MTSPPSASSSPASLQGNEEGDYRDDITAICVQLPGLFAGRALPMAVLFQPGPARHIDRPRSLASTSPRRHEHATRGPLICIRGYCMRGQRVGSTRAEAGEADEGAREGGRGGVSARTARVFARVFARACLRARVCARVSAGCDCDLPMSCFRVRGMVLGPWPRSLAPCRLALCRLAPCRLACFPARPMGREDHIERRGPYPHLSLCATTTHTDTHLCVYVHMCSRVWLTRSSRVASVRAGVIFLVGVAVWTT